jgi:hypothetical protein
MLFKFAPREATRTDSDSLTERGERALALKFYKKCRLFVVELRAQPYCTSEGAEGAVPFQITCHEKEALCSSEPHSESVEPSPGVRYPLPPEQSRIASAAHLSPRVMALWTHESQQEAQVLGYCRASHAWLRKIRKESK